MATETGSSGSPRLPPSGRIVTAAKVVWTISVASAAAYFLYRHGSTSLWPVSSLPGLLLSVVMILLAKCAFAGLVGQSIACTHHSIPMAASFYAYSVADVAKYVPGGIWSLAGRLVLYRGLGLSGSDTARALLIEHGFLLGGALAAGGALLVSAHLVATGAAAALSAFAAVCVAWCLIALVANCGMSVRSEYRRGNTAALALLQFCAWTLCGLSFALLLPGSSIAGFLSAAGAFDLSFALGMVAVFAPAGIGVREGAVGSLLQDQIPIASVVAYALMHRFLWFIADAAMFGAVYLMCRRTWLGEVERAKRLGKDAFRGGDANGL